MKKMIVTGLLALAMTATSGQEASAWCKFCWSCGFNISYESTGCNTTWCFSRVSNPPPCYPSCNPCYSGYCGYPGYSPYPAYAYSPALPGTPAVAAPAPQQTQQVGYTFYGQGYAPSYWYGY
jgi:hypothetical protein